jgi:hypothetical protein
MTTGDGNWDVLRAEWQHGADSASIVASADRQMIRALRRARIAQLVEGITVIVAVALVALALLHAANALHAALGIVVVAGIGGAWIWRRDLARQEQRALEQNTTESSRMRRIIRDSQARSALFIWLTIALDLVFLIPWWIRSARVHARRLTDVQTFEVMWLPLLGMALLALWAWRVRARARRESSALA